MLYWAIGGLLGAATSLLSGGKDCHCRVDCGVVPGPSGPVLDLLRSQLERCGPERLQCPACPPCPGFDFPAAPAHLPFVWFLTGLLLGSVIGRLSALILGGPALAPPLQVQVDAPGRHLGRERLALREQVDLPPVVPPRPALQGLLGWDQ